jgi:hypothetical protein
MCGAPPVETENLLMAGTMAIEATADGGERFNTWCEV